MEEQEYEKLQVLLNVLLYPLLPHSFLQSRLRNHKTYQYNVQIHLALVSIKEIGKASIAVDGHQDFLHLTINRWYAVHFAIYNINVTNWTSFHLHFTARMIYMLVAGLTNLAYPHASSISPIFPYITIM